MKRIKGIPLSVLAAGLLLPAVGCSTPQNTNTATSTNMATPEATPDTAAITAEVTRIEKDWPRMIKDRDAAAVRRIEADDVVLVYPDGSIGGKDQDVKDIESGNLSYDAWEVSDINVKVVDADAAVASVHIVVKNGKYKTPDGKAADISGEYRAIDTFARRNGQGQLIASATTPIKSPAKPTASPSPSPKSAAAASPTMKASPTTKASPVAKPSPARKPSPVTAKTP